ncbi:hypothetical protein VPNG_03944 [Cytospora leucostoma]|uniref:Uncharacterized protein n=1 Tax=Cytospora leucostoma TaxID=1230097 RepID=A0A423XDW9_9PEZI|nr:hypothetical protein VPNG_03944 [Cytospora leucostoma]
MEAVVQNRGRPEPDHEIEFADGTVDISQDEDYDFDIGGPEDNLDTEAGAQFTDAGLTNQVESSHDLDNTSTLQVPEDEGAHQPTEEMYYQEDQNQDHGHAEDVLDTSEFDATVETEELGEGRQDEDRHGSHIEEETKLQQVEEGQLEEFEVHEDEITYEETAAEYEGFDDAARPNGEETNDTTHIATSVEYAHHDEGEGFEAHQEAEDDNGAHVEPRQEFLPEGNHSDEINEDEATTAANPDDEVPVGSLEAHTDAEDDVPVTQQDADTVEESLADGDWHEDGHEDKQHSDEQPNVRVLWRTEEYRLFADTPVDDPDTYFFKDLDFLQQPLTQFLSGLRQVIANELTPSEELYVKVDGLGIEFGETTTTEFLEKTAFGQIIDLYKQLLQLDDGSESHELYLYLEARPNCLQRFSELTNGAQEGLGLSHFALYYEDASTDVLVNEEDEDQYEGPRDIYSDDLSISGSHDEPEGDTDEAHQAEQPHNPFRITDAQRHAIDVSSTGLEEGGENNTTSAGTGRAHGSEDGLDNTDVVPGEDQGGLDLEAQDDVDDVPIDENPQDIITGQEGDEDVANEELGENYGVEGDDEQNLADDGVGGEEAIADVLEDESGEKHDPTDGKKPFLYESSECSAPRICYCDECMSSEPPSPGPQSILPKSLGLMSRIPAHTLAGGSYSKAPQNASADKSPTGGSALEGRSLKTSNTDLGGFYLRKNHAADSHTQDENAADNDDYLDLDNDDVGTTDDKLDEHTEHAGTLDIATHDSSATATLNGDDHANGDDASVAEDPADASYTAETSNQPDADPSQNDLDEIDWKEGEDDENDVADQTLTDLSPTNISVKRGRQDEENEGLGGTSPVKRQRV